MYCGILCKRNCGRFALEQIKILPFNIDHAKQAGAFAKIIFDGKKFLGLTNRTIIPNDTKLFAQASIEQSIKFYLTSDGESKKIYDALRTQNNSPAIGFEFKDLHIPYNQAFGILDLK